jgi:hypothetical protein
MIKTERGSQKRSNVDYVVFWFEAWRGGDRAGIISVFPMISAVSRQGFAYSWRGGLHFLFDVD